MYETINEPIEVICAYLKDKVLPLYFRWQNSKYKVDQVDLVHSVRSGADKLYFYSVSQKSNYFKLGFNSASNKWQLVEAYLSLG